MEHSTINDISYICDIKEILNCNHVQKVKIITLNNVIIFDDMKKIMDKIVQFINLEKIHFLNISENIFNNIDFSNICKLDNIKVIFIKYENYPFTNIKTIITSEDTIILKLYKKYLDVSKINNFNYSTIKIMNINNDVFYDLKYILQNISNNTEKLELFFDESPYAIINEEYFYKILNNLPIGIKILTIIYFEHPNNKY